MQKSSKKIKKTSGAKTERLVKDCLANAKMAMAWAKYWEAMAEWYRGNGPVVNGADDPGGNPPPPPPKVPPIG